MNTYLRLTVDNLKQLEGDIASLKKNSSSSEVNTLQKDVISIRSVILNVSSLNV